jgi:hypothetical protein
MKKTITIILFVFTFALSAAFFGVVRAQEVTPLAKLAQEYLTRMNVQEGRFVSSDAIVNPAQFERAAVTESIDTINRAVEEIRAEKQKVVTEVQESVKKDIDNSIVSIRKSTQKPAYELQRAIDAERTLLFENVAQTIADIHPVEVSLIQSLQTEVSRSLDLIRERLESESGMSVSFERSMRDVRGILTQFEQVLNEKREVIESREGDLVFLDSDQDNLSDYDELYVYRTDPNNPKTKEGALSDGEKVREGINPLSDSSDKVLPQDPRNDKDAYVSSTYKVNKVQLIREDRERLVFEGNALPNSYVTLFIYSTPVIATVRTDSSGTWSYELEQELENGEHQMYVATVDSSGKLLARSNPILFTKSAEAATIGIAGSLERSVGAQTFFRDNFILITLATLIAAVILTMMFFGSHKDIKSAVADLRNEVNRR